jgi:DNA-binding transcriptional ArsR family regulator
MTQILTGARTRSSRQDSKAGRLKTGRSTGAGGATADAMRRRRSKRSSKNMTGLMGNASIACDFLKLFANETRLEILCTLADGEKSVGEIEASLAVRQPAISQQLARLRAENAVTARRQGKRVFYQLADDRIGSVVDIIYELFCQDGCRETRCAMRRVKGHD